MKIIMTRKSVFIYPMKEKQTALKNFECASILTILSVNVVLTFAKFSIASLEGVCCSCSLR